MHNIICEYHYNINHLKNQISLKITIECVEIKEWHLENEVPDHLNNETITFNTTITVSSNLFTQRKKTKVPECVRERSANEFDQSGSRIRWEFQIQNITMYTVAL